MSDRDHRGSGPGGFEGPENAWLIYNSATMAATVRQFFVGRDGIRAGWRFSIFVALVVVFRVAAFRVPPIWRILKSTESGTLTPFSDGIAAVLSALTAFLAAFIMSRIEKRRLTSYGIPVRGAFGKLFWSGIVWGLGILTLEMLIIHALGGFDFGGFALHGGTLVYYAAAWALNFVIVGTTKNLLSAGIHSSP
jgi:CAAX protease family protein